MNKTASLATRNRLLSVDVLRAVAALAVLFCHVNWHMTGEPSEVRYWLTRPLALGHLGVPLFIVLSGFCIHLGIARRMAQGGSAQADWRRFWKRRFLRLFPPYLAAILFSLAMYYFVCDPSLVTEKAKIVSLPAGIITHLLLVQNLFIQSGVQVGNGAFWTLGLEEQLYLLFAFYLWMRRRSNPWAVLGVALLLGLLWRCIFFLHQILPNGSDNAVGGAALQLGEWWRWPLAYWFLWILGALAAEGYTGAFTLPRWCFQYRVSLPLLFLGLATDSDVYINRIAPDGRLASILGENTLHAIRVLAPFTSSVAFGIAVFALLNRSIRNERECGFHSRVAKALAAVGVMSYSLYLTHFPVVYFLESHLPSGSDFVSMMCRYLATIPACLAFGFVFFRMVESRFLHGSQATRLVSRGKGAVRGGERTVETVPTSVLEIQRLPQRRPDDEST